MCALRRQLSSRAFGCYQHMRLQALRWVSLLRNVGHAAGKCASSMRNTIAMYLGCPSAAKGFNPGGPAALFGIASSSADSFECS